MLRIPTRPRSSKADKWGNAGCFGVAVINESVVAGDLFNKSRQRGGAIGSGADPTIPSVKSSDGRDYLYKTQIQQLPTCVIVNRAIEPNILTNALPPSKSHDHSPLKDSTYP